MRSAIAQPCSEAACSVRRMSRSSVPGRRSGTECGAIGAGCRHYDAMVSTVNIMARLEAVLLRTRSQFARDAKAPRVLAGSPGTVGDDHQIREVPGGVAGFFRQ